VDRKKNGTKTEKKEKLTRKPSGGDGTRGGERALATFKRRSGKERKKKETSSYSKRGIVKKKNTKKRRERRHELIRWRA